jgi:HD-like signal output (HDOD) protein
MMGQAGSDSQRALQQLTEALRSPSFRPPILPAVAQEALKVARRAQAGMSEMAALIERDQVLAARFLSVANSSMYRQVMPATSVTVALTRIGIEAARDVLIYASLEPFLFTCERFAKEMDILRRHSLVVSAAAGQLARLKQIPSGDASLAGLVHDIGAVALLKYVADHASQLTALFATQTGVADAVAQLHCMAGQRIGLFWNLPQPIQVVLASHHQVTKESPPLLQLVEAADDLATRAGGGSPMDLRFSAALDLYLGDPKLVKRALGDFGQRVADL